MFFESQVILLSIFSKVFKAISNIFPSWWLKAGIKHLKWPLCICLRNIEASHVWNLLLNNVHCELVDRVVAVACHDIWHRILPIDLLVLKFDSLGCRWNPTLKVVSKITSTWWIVKACSERSSKLIGHSWSIGWLTCTEYTRLPFYTLLQKLLWNAILIGWFLHTSICDRTHHSFFEVLVWHTKRGNLILISQYRGLSLEHCWPLALVK